MEAEKTDVQATLNVATSVGGILKGALVKASGSSKSALKGISFDRIEQRFYDALSAGGDKFASGGSSSAASDGK